MSVVTPLESMRGLVAFATAVEAGGFAAAGRRLGLSPSAVGKAVARLEARLGVVLLNRTTRSIALTGEGELLYARARRILDDVREAEDALAGSRSAPGGRLRVTLPATLGRRVVIPALPAFTRRYPQIELDVGLDDRKVDIIEEGYDLALRTGSLASSSLIARSLGPHRFVVCASPAYFAERGVPATPDDLARHVCLRFRYPTTGRLEEWAFSARAPKTLPPGPVFNDGEAVVVAAMAGLGVAQAPSYAVAEAVAAGRLQVALADYAVKRGDLWLVWPPGRADNRRVRAFIDFLADLMAEL